MGFRIERTNVAPYAWKITSQNDEWFDPSELVGIHGPSNGEFDLLPADTERKFRIKDDDGELYCTGVIRGDFDGFEPMNDYGTVGLGATTIEYWEPGKGGGWKVL